jgi:hypothetical protein
MSEEERQDWLNMKAVLEDYLTVIDEQILRFSAYGKDDEYQFLLKKAVEYRDTIHKINELLRKN